MYEELKAVSAAVSSAKAAFDLTKAIFGVAGAIQNEGQVFELQRVILATQDSALKAQETQLSLLERVREAEQKAADLEAWEREKERYQLTSPSRGLIAYELKPEARGTEPPHLLCANCFENKHKRYFQCTGDFLGSDVLECRACGEKLIIPTAETHRRKAAWGRDADRPPTDWKTA